MILKTFLTEKVPVACTTILGLIFSTRWCSITQGANIVTFMCVIVESVTRITYIPFRHSSLDVGNYIVVPIVRIIKQIQFLGRMGISTENEPIRTKSIKHNNFVIRKVVLKLLVLQGLHHWINQGRKPSRGLQQVSSVHTHAYMMRTLGHYSREP